MGMYWCIWCCIGVYGAVYVVYGDLQRYMAMYMGVWECMGCMVMYRDVWCCIGVYFNV